MNRTDSDSARAQRHVRTCSTGLQLVTESPRQSTLGLSECLTAALENSALTTPRPQDRAPMARSRHRPG
eukprot:CAMPEP_0185197444 /NCGR_PEP_ID=MMETSP1140-20130426/40403_1 /TAXON_ID=298111 /ORGANISM="Pavlova sp., Strain CCMP459" /LENGTH=68 /DNA_ID=CAMNT_0027764561 /DNA_START=111 /DNA_END=317 /DNA_ORIENTATION=+